MSLKTPRPTKNAKEELAEILLKYSDSKISCANIRHDERNYFLVQNYTEEHLKAFMDSLDFDYDNGYGIQELFGYVWFQDGTWLERYEYDGSEHWVYKKTPVIPKHLEPVQRAPLGSKIITCILCSGPIIFTGGEQEYFTIKGLSDPKKCKKCRALRKQ